MVRRVCVVVVALWSLSSSAQSPTAETMTPPTLAHSVDPAYPDDAFREGVAGDVVMDVEVAADGGVARVVVLQAPDARLAWAALGALTNFAFEPAHMTFADGHAHAIAVRLTYSLTFAIDQEARQALLHDNFSTDVTDHAVDADTPLQAPATLPVAESVVRARRGHEDVTKTLTQSAAVLDAAALARVRGRTLAGALVEIPGVTMVQSGPSVAKPVVRGAFGRRLVMLTDGVRHEGQDWGIDHAPEIDPQAAGSITVVKGAAGVRFGPDAIGGVVLLEPRRLRLDPGVDGEVNMVGVDNGLRGTIGGRVDWVPTALPSLTLRFEANASKSAAVSAPDYVLGNTATETINVGGAVEWRGAVLDHAVTAKLTYHRFQTNLGICYCLKVNTPAELQASIVADKPAGSDAWTASFDVDRPRQQVSHDTAIARIATDLFDVGALTLTYAFQLDLRDEFDQVRRAVTGPQFSFNLITHAVDVAFQHATFHSGDLTLTGQVGLHLDLQQHAYSGLQLIPNYRRATGGVFVLERLVIEDAMSLGDLEFVVGGRVDGLVQTSFLTLAAFTTQLRRDRITAADCTLISDVARCDKNLPAASITAGSRVHLDVANVRDAVVFSVDVSSATRFPDVDELYLGGRSPSLPVFGLGDTSLGPERTLQLSTGVELKLPFVVVEAGAFASRINDYIAFGPELNAQGQPVVDVLITGAYPRFSSQAVEAMMSGVDGGVVVLPGALLSASAQIAFVRALDLTHGTYLPFIPPAQARLGLQSNLPTFETVMGTMSLSSVSTGVVLVARQDRTDTHSDFVAPAAAYALWNAEAHGTIDVGGLPVQLGLEVRNILNQRYRDQLSLLRFFADQPGREVWLRAGISFDAS